MLRRSASILTLLALLTAWVALPLSINPTTMSLNSKAAFAADEKKGEMKASDPGKPKADKKTKKPKKDKKAKKDKKDKKPKKDKKAKKAKDCTSDKPCNNNNEMKKDTQ